MQYFPLRREYQVIYVLIGLVFLVVAVSLWREWGALPEGDSWLFLYFVRNATVTVLGILLILRSWRSRLGVDDTGISYADGLLPTRRIPFSVIRAVFSNRGKRTILYTVSGGSLYLEYTFEGLDTFLAFLGERNIPVLDKPLAKNQLRNGGSV